MLYPEKAKAALSAETFQNPGAEYRGTPFWAWNSELNQETLNRQIDCMKEMGFGGFHMHVRVGLTTEYLSSEFMAFIKGCTDKAKREQMLAWLYDEDKWPSGFAGGLVTKNPKYRARRLVFSVNDRATQGQDEIFPVPWQGWKRNGSLLARYAVTLDADGCMKEYRRLQTDEACPEGAHLRYAYLDMEAASDWYNGQTYLDTLSAEAVQEFVNVTHEKYAQALSRDFGKVIPAIFTDEPQTSQRETLNSPFGAEDAALPWTDDLPQSYQALYDEDILDFVPELFLELPQGEISRVRYRYHEHASERFAAAFADTIGSWCEAHSLLLTGHMMNEPTLHSQTIYSGDCMRSYRSFQLPGIDMLGEARELNTAKQCQSAVHQYARPGMLSELYGVSNWDYRFHQHKLQGDWQAALGVSVRVPHLYWVSMRGEAKRDYPASIGHQSPWYPQYKFIEDHFARVSSAMTRGKPLVKIGVIHPIESYWLHWGPESQTRAARDEMDDRFAQLTDWLLYNQLDFDFISEAQLLDLYNPQGEGFQVGAMHYDVVLVPNMETIRSTTLKALGAFHATGGDVIYIGKTPDYMDGVCREDGFYCKYIEWSRTELLRQLEPYRLHSVTQNSKPADNILSQWRTDGTGRWLFLCHAKDSSRYYTNKPRRLQIAVKGDWCVQKYDTLTGGIADLPVRYEGGNTMVDWAAYPQDSLLLRLEPGMQTCTPEPEVTWLQAGELPARNPITLAEPNVLVLDMPEWSLDGQPWQPREEVLRIGDGCKTTLGLSNEISRGCQPWVLKNDPAAVPSHTLRLRHAIQSDIALGKVQLAIEDLATLTLRWNGIEIPAVPEGHYVDEAIQTVTLGALQTGENLLEIEVPFGKVTTVENCFLLGDFGVEVHGRDARIIEAPRSLAFGDWTRQGLPFYGGNVVYHTQAELSDGTASYAVEVSNFTLPVIGVAMDGEECGPAAISPWRVSLGSPAAGMHRIDITAYGNRVNTFGALHNCDYANRWYGPNAWRTQGGEWTYEYRLRESGVLSAPRILTERKNES